MYTDPERIDHELLNPTIAENLPPLSGFLAGEISRGRVCVHHARCRVEDPDLAKFTEIHRQLFAQMSHGMQALIMAIPDGYDARQLAAKAALLSNHQ
jgi:hypothetical protein